MHQSLKLFAASIVVAVLLGIFIFGPDSDTGPADGPPLVLYCAAGIMLPVEAAILEYEAAYGTAIRVEPAGSGALLSKIRFHSLYRLLDKSCAKSEPVKDFDTLTIAIY